MNFYSVVDNIDRKDKEKKILDESLNFGVMLLKKLKADSRGVKQ